MSAIYGVPAVLGSALGYAVASVLQQGSAVSAPRSHSLHLRLLADLARRRAWIAGSAASVAAFGLQALALHFAPLALVQPLLLVELVFALPLAAHRRGRAMGAREWSATAAIAAGLALLLVFAAPSGGQPNPALTTWGELAGSCIAVIGVLLAMARGPSRPLRATLLGACAGVAFGLLSALLDSFTFVVAQRGMAGALASWQPYALAVVAVGGEVLAQSAYQAGPLAASLPVMDAMEPAAAIAIGIAAFGEHVIVDAVRVVPELAGLAIVAAGIIALDNSPLILELQADP